MRAVVVGAGPGGLATALGLHRLGVAVTVCDRDADVVHRGAAIGMWWNGIAALRALGLDAALLEGHVVTRRAGYRNASGRLLAAVPAAEFFPAAATPFVAVARADLQRVLLDALRDAGAAPPRLGAGVVGLAGGTVTLSDGSRLAADLVVGADGVRSRVRELAFPGAARVRDTRLVGWTGVARVPGAVPELPAFEHLAGADGAAFFAPSRPGHVFWGAIATTRPGDPREPAAGSRAADGAAAREAALGRYAGWWPPLLELIAATPPEDLVEFRVSDLRPPRRWVSGPVALVGDAAHAMVPHLAQGTCQALTDAVALRDHLAVALAPDAHRPDAHRPDASGPNTSGPNAGRPGAGAPAGEATRAVRTALAGYERERRGPGARVARVSRLYARTIPLQDPVFRAFHGPGLRGRARRSALGRIERLFEPHHGDVRYPPGTVVPAWHRRGMLDEEARYRAVLGKDARFDGWFVTCVTSTGIYCRPSCPALTPKRENVRFLPGPAAAQQAGFRACKRCRPDATLGSPEWDLRADLVGRAMRLIGDGVVDREGVAGLARRLGFSERHLHRQLVAEVGAGPVAVARAQRAQTARLLLETTDLPITDVAFAAGFASVRQFNDTVREIFAVTPTQLRASRRDPADTAAGAILLRLPYRAPIDLDALFRFLGARAVPGVESYEDGVYSRSLPLPHGPGIATLSAGPGYVRCELRLTDLRDLSAAVHRCRRLLDLDADPAAVVAALGDDPVLGQIVRKAPGLRVPGHVDGAEMAVRAVLGQQVSVEAARKLAAKLTDAHGERLAAPHGAVTTLFPTPAALREVELGMPAARLRALRGLAAALADGDVELHPGVDRADTERRLLALPGIGPWTASYLAFRALRDPDVFLANDVGVRVALTRLGLPGDPAAATALAETWRPWRSYALLHLWHSLDRKDV